MKEENIFKKLEKYKFIKGSKNDENIESNNYNLFIVYFENFSYLTNSFQESIKTNLKLEISYITSNPLSQKLYFLTNNSKFGIFDVYTNKYEL
jgi:hypothetical protein